MIDQFLDFLKHERKYSAHTLTAYSKDLTQFDDFLQIAFEVSILYANHSMVRSWMAYLVETGVSNRSLNSKISALKS